MYTYTYVPTPPGQVRGDLKEKEEKISLDRWEFDSLSSSQWSFNLSHIQSNSKWSALSYYTNVTLAILVTEKIAF